MNESLEAAVQARTLLMKLVSFQINKEVFLKEWEHIPANKMISNYWKEFQNSESTTMTSCLEIYQLINSLTAEIDYQLQFYGIDSLWEDIKQLDMAIRVLKQHLGTENQN